MSSLRIRRFPAAIVAIVVLLVAAPVLMVSRHIPAQPVPARAAIRDALRNPAVDHALAGTHWSSDTASGLDGQLERVSFLAGSRQVAQVAVRADGTVDQVQALAHEAVPYGDWIAYEPTVLAALGVLFVLMAGVAPLRRLRNLDVLAATTLVIPVVLFQHGYLNGSVLAAVPGLGYLMLRCAWRGLGPPEVSPPAEVGRRASLQRAPKPPATPLFEHVTREWEPGQRIRILRLLLAALALVFVMVGVSSPNAVDVAYAAMEGATQIIHGLLPYGHMPGDVVHGDTYPILSYALYAPLAWLSPVDSVFSSVNGALALTALAAIAAAAGLYRASAGPRHRSPGADAAGLRAAITWLSFPPLMIIASTGTTDVVLAAMLAFAVVLWRRPGASMALLAVAGWFKLAPFALVPVWLAPLRGRRLAAAIGALLGVSAATLGLVLFLGGVHGPAAMARAVAYQLDRGSLQSPWAALGITAWQPIGQACVLALIAGSVARLLLDPELVADRARIAALSAAILLGLQLVANYWTFLYLAWVVPLIGLSLLAQDTRARAYAAGRVPAAPSIPDILIIGR
ncbi:MAG TPA: hypothetical protein VIJ20_12050 [Solirubrobacteraceae bacterium]